jgi:hypothetical protein
MTLKHDFALSLATLACLGCYSTAAIAQTAAAKPLAPRSALSAAPETATPAAEQGPAVAPTPAPAPETVPAAAAPSQPRPASAPVLAVPPGYALVPIDNGGQTRYDVEYPQRQGALPPGMELPYEEGEPVPLGYRVVKQTRRGLVIAGSIVGGIAYGFSIVGATSDDFNHKSGSLLVPVLGPWIMLALGGAKDVPSTGYCFDTSSSSCGSRSGLRGVLVLDGLMQGAGAAMLIVGIAVPKTRLVRKDVTLSMLPMPLGKDGYGLGAVGQF